MPDTGWAEWREAVELQHALSEWWRTPTGRTYAEAWVADMLGTAVDAPEDVGERLRAAGRVTLSGLESMRLLESDVYWISEDMGDLTDAAATTMPPQPLLPQDVPTPTGFAVFQRPIVLRDQAAGPDQRITVKAMCWTPAGEPGGLMVTTYADHRSFAEPLDSIHALVRSRGMTPPPLELAAITPWMWDESWLTYAGDLEAAVRGWDGRSPGITAQILRLLAALWTLTRQPIAVATTATRPRQDRRRYEREGRPIPRIQIITLRRLRHGDAVDGEHHQREYSHRWVVNGHWRNQWLPSAGTHRLTFIAPYVKGPEDAPLVVKQKVYRWTR